MTNIESLRSALEHVTMNFRRILAGTPVKDASECLSAADCALREAEEQCAAVESTPVPVSPVAGGKLDFGPFSDTEVWAARREVGKWLNEETSAPAPRQELATLCAALDIAAHAVSSAASAGEAVCSDHPDAPHGFDRNGSHNAGRYVCDCEGWVPPEAFATQELGNSGEPYLTGAWRHKDGRLFCGSLRVLVVDFDTTPAPESQAEFLDWVCSTMNTAVAAQRNGKGGSQAASDTERLLSELLLMRGRLLMLDPKQDTASLDAVLIRVNSRLRGPVARR